MRKTPLKKKSKASIPKLKQKLWDLTSKYVRLSHADESGMVKCATCETIKHWKDIQAGHWIAKAQGNATAWDLRNIHPQCYRCNINLGGNGPEYTFYMLRRYGEPVCDELRQLSKTTRKITRAEYETMIDEMAEKLSKLTSKAFIVEPWSSEWARNHCS